MPSTNISRGKTDLQRNLNRIKVLQLVRNEKEITRADIIHKTKLSAPTVTRIVDGLLKQHLVQSDLTGTSIGGRPPQLIRFCSKENYVIGIDMGATFIRSALSNLDGEFIFEIHIPTNLKKGFEGVMQQVGELIEKLIDRATKKNIRLLGVGVAVCGMVNKNSGLVEYSPVFGWKNVDVKKALGHFTDLDIAIGNVTHLIALGELLYGVGKDHKDFICINLGYGIGSGIIINGRPFMGADGLAGEFGHIVIDRYHNRQGREGVAGTIESLASGYGIVEIARERLRDGNESLLSKLDPADIDAHLVFEAAKEGDWLATEIVDSVAENLSLGIDTLIKLFNTECISLSGGIAQNGEFFIQKIRDNLKIYEMSAISRQVPVVLSSFGENAALMGSFSLILEKILFLDQKQYS